VHPNAAGADVIARTVQRALVRTEITPGPSHVTASTQDSNVPANTVDESLVTRWSGNGDGAFIQYDLGFVREVGRIQVAGYLGNARRYRFDLQTSSCCGAWTTVWSGESSGTTTNEESYDFADVGARYVRLVGHGNNVNGWNGVTELSIFPPVNLALGRAATASSTWSASFDAGKAVDGTTSSRWSAASGQASNQWLAVDLGASRNLRRVVVQETSYPRVTSYVLQASSDGVTYVDIPGTTGTTLGASRTITFTAVTVRHLRLYVHTASGVPTINELQAYTN